MRAMEPNSVDAIVCDPPYGLEFMGKEWDNFRATPKGRADLLPSAPHIHATEPGQWQPGRSYGAPKKNPRCRTCGRLKFDKAKYKCACDAPQWDTRTREGAQNFQRFMTEWAVECLRVAKPGAHLVAFGGTRTFHRLACAIEDAGWEIRDTLSWLYGSGFPKSLDVSKALDAQARSGKSNSVALSESEKERPVVGSVRRVVSKNRRAANAGEHGVPANMERFHDYEQADIPVTAPATDAAKQWAGWGTALKPAWEPIILARKPLAGTVARTVSEYGTGAMNVDACRIGTDESLGRLNHSTSTFNHKNTTPWVDNSTGKGRWPANVVLSHAPECRQVGTRKIRSSQPATFRRAAAENDGNTSAAYGKESRPEGHVTPGYGDANGQEEVAAWDCAPDCAVRLLDEQSGERKAPGSNGRKHDTGTFSVGTQSQQASYTDAGGASRFFYTAKASRREREAGLEGMPTAKRKMGGHGNDEQDDLTLKMGSNRPAANVHPTVKPLALMRWLCRLVTPPGGTVLDPFCGSGSTGCAAVLEGFRFVGIEQDAEYVAIAERRIAHWAQRASISDLAAHAEQHGLPLYTPREITDPAA
jgi:site-specific DNA-methyltransferase (adenine-specific)